MPMHRMLDQLMIGKAVQEQVPQRSLPRPRHRGRSVPPWLGCSQTDRTGRLPRGWVPARCDEIVLMTELPERVRLPELARLLFDGPNHMTVATVDPDGRPQLSLVWAKTDGDDVLFSTIKGRRKYANLTRDPRATALVYAAENPYSYAEVRGSVTIADDPAADLINELALKYTGESFPNRPHEQRVIVRIRPERVVCYQD